MVMMMMMMQQQNSSAQPQPQPQSQSTASATAATANNSSLRSPTTAAAAATHAPRQAIPIAAAADHAIGPVVVPISVEPPVATTMLPRVRLSDVAPYDGAPAGPYLKAVEALSGSLMRHNAAVIELGSEDAAIMRCGLEAARLYFRTKSQTVGKGSRGVYMYRAGRALEDWDSSPPCMADIFRCMGKAARAALFAIARHLRLRSDVFNHLLDDTPLPANEVSSSVLVATYSPASLQNGKGAIGAIGGGKPAMNGEVEKGLLTLISSDSPGLQVCDPNGRWYLADGGSAPGDLLLITGKALSHATAGLRPAALYRAAPDFVSCSNGGGRTSLAFRLMPQGNAILDCSPIAAAGHVIPQSYVPISVSQFMDDLSAEEDGLCNRSDNTYSRCTICSAEIETGSLVPNLALRAAAVAIKQEDDRRLFHNAALRKRRKEMGDQMDPMRRSNRENGDATTTDDGLNRGVQYPFSVNEKVLIKGNRRTPEKFVGKEAVITSQCLNGWYLLNIIGSGENVRLQYRSLRKILNSQTIEDSCPSHQVQNSSS
ncbi:RING/U-box superfamily protein [Citrus sinensis]|uniref:RING/U-box superfamily protein n=1 Tax=Citrus sinensis TaxID=2711 RepID=A0ACB8LEG8_CITSI|nr:RING/U-box superfamily protein [Citrus sinensis]